MQPVPDRLWIVGAGGFAAELLHTIRSDATAGMQRSGTLAFAVEDPAMSEFMGLEVHDLDRVGAGDHFVIAIGAGKVRERLLHKLAGCGARAYSAMAPTAVVGPNITLGEGAVLSDFTILTANAAIGRQFQCNIYSYVAHDCRIGDFVTFAPKVCCNGNVHIGDHAYVGTGAILRQGTPEKPLRIGAGATIGMGAVVTKDVGEGETVVGNPARPMQRS